MHRALTIGGSHGQYHATSLVTSNVCPLCNSTLSSKTIAKQHLRNAIKAGLCLVDRSSYNREATDDIMIDNDDHQYECQVCNQKIAHPFVLTSHLCTHVVVDVDLELFFETPKTRDMVGQPLFQNHLQLLVPKDNNILWNMVLLLMQWETPRIRNKASILKALSKLLFGKFLLPPAAPQSRIADCEARPELIIPLLVLIMVASLMEAFPGNAGKVSSAEGRPSSKPREEAPPGGLKRSLPNGGGSAGTDANPEAHKDDLHIIKRHMALMSKKMLQMDMILMALEGMLMASMILSTASPLAQELLECGKQWKK